MDGGRDSSREQNVSKRRQQPSDSAADDHEAPKAKRHRVSRACDQCRLSRDKCDGKAPCHTCGANGRGCSYTTSPKKRGIQPGYIRTLELSLALLIGRDHEAQSFLLNQLSSSGSSLRQSVSLKDTSQPDDLFAKWTTSGICKQIDILLSGSHEGDLPITADMLDSGPATEIDLAIPDQPPQAAADSTLQLPADFWTLLDHYYAYTHNWLPISEKNEIYKVAYSYPLIEAEIRNRPDLGRHAELWAIIALTCQQRSGTPTAVRSAVTIARRLIPQEAAVYDCGHVRALLLLALWSFAIGDKVVAWVEIGMAVRVLTYLMTQNSDDSRFKHLTLACYAIENIISANLNTRPHLTKSILGLATRINEDGLEEWSPWQPLIGDQDTKTFALQHTLSRQPGRCLSTFNTLITVCTTLASSSDKAERAPSSGGNAWPSDAVSNATSTPHQLHINAVSAWARYRKGGSSTAEFEQTVLHVISQFQRCGGETAIPPTLIPIIDCVFPYGDSRLTDMGPSSASTLFNIWRDMSSIHPQTTQSSHTSDASYSTPQQHPGAIFVPQNSHQPLLTASYSANRRESNQTFVQNLTGDGALVGVQSMSMDANGIPNTPINQDTPSGISDGAMGSDFEAIFEEMAQLEGTRQANDPSQFMHNLGLGPDADLRAFFGADYQESDPLLAYLQFEGLPTS
ncbi:hypothetical protein ANO11243_003150 [Dothideomycetidae sp. 11243]|nr:hypothetical protein ANO11243_003150 [fungal sp. No.11243]